MPPGWESLAQGESQVFVKHTTTQVVMGRRLVGVFLTIYMPTISMNIIGHSTNYFKPFFFEAQVTVNLTVSIWQYNYYFSFAYYYFIIQSEVTYIVFGTIMS